MLALKETSKPETSLGPSFSFVRFQRVEVGHLGRPSHTRRPKNRDSIFVPKNDTRGREEGERIGLEAWRGDGRARKIHEASMIVLFFVSFSLYIYTSILPLTFFFPASTGGGRLVAAASAKVCQTETRLLSLYTRSCSWECLICFKSVDQLVDRRTHAD